jgi:hypothetical protein
MGSQLEGATAYSSSVPNPYLIAVGRPSSHILDDLQDASEGHDASLSTETAQALVSTQGLSVTFGVEL